MNAVVVKRNRRGVLAMLLAVGLFSFMDAGLKRLSAYYPAAEVAALRALASLPLVTLWVLATVGVKSLFAIRWPLHLLRGVLAVLMMVGFSYSLRTLALSTAYSLFFVAPLMITALSGPMLGERVGRARWLAVAVGGIGVLVVLRPSTDGMLGLAGFAVIGAAAAYSLSAVMVRVISRSDSSQALVFWMLAMMAAGSTALALPYWLPLRDTDLWLVAGIGVAGALAQYAITEAFRLTEASQIAPLEYTALAWGIGLDGLIWQVWPDALTLLGAAIIVASGVYLLRHERVHLEAEHP